MVMKRSPPHQTFSTNASFATDHKVIMNSCHICFLYLTMLIIISCGPGIRSGASDMVFLSYDGTHNQSTKMKTKQKESYPGERKTFVKGRCTKRDLSISQSRDCSSGIPQYIVQIVNTCVSNCAPSDIHLHCGWFASARMVNPRTFKRLSYDDCLVNGGKPLKISQTIRFTYSNSFMYPLALKSAKFC